MSTRVYLDWNATSPPLPEVIEAMREALAKTWANPASIHADGRAARAVVEGAREAVAELTGVDARDVTFTANATEANNLALRSVAPKTKILTSRLEHPSITRTVDLLERAGVVRVAWIKVLPSGLIDLADLESHLEANALVTIQAVTHETGIIQPVSDVVTKAKAKGARVHVDAAQGWGKVNIATGWDTAHPVAMLPGCGARAYLVQDHEPEFFASSAERIWAEQTYDLGLYPICASRWLRDLLAEEHCCEGAYFHLGVDHDVYRPLPGIERRRDTVIFYARAGTARRAVPLGVLALEELCARRPGTRIVAFGQAAPLKTAFANESLGVATPERLARAYS